MPATVASIMKASDYKTLLLGFMCLCLFGCSKAPTEPVLTAAPVEGEFFSIPDINLDMLWCKPGTFMMDSKEGSVDPGATGPNQEKKGGGFLDAILGLFLLALVFSSPIWIIGGLILTGYYFRKKRTKALKAFALSNGFQFKEKRTRIPDSHELLHLFSQGRNKSVWNEMSRRDQGFELTMMDYSFKIGGGHNKGSKTYRQTVVMTEVRELNFPPFEIRPENFLHKIAATVGYKDIDFRSHPIFSRKYLLRGADEEQIRERMNHELLRFLERQKGISMECDGSRVIYYRYNKKVSPDSFQAFFEEANEAMLLLLSSPA